MAGRKNVNAVHGKHIDKDKLNITKEDVYYDEHGFPKGFDTEGVLKILREAYRYIDNNDYQKSLRKFFDELAPISYNTLLRYAHRNPKIRYALKKIKELNEIKLSEKCYNYLRDMKEWFVENKEAIYVGDYFEEHREFNRKKIEDLAAKFEAVKELWDEILQIQESRLVRFILTNKNIKGATFVLKNMHQWSESVDKVEHDVDIRVERMSVDNDDRVIDIVDDDGEKNKILKLENG